MGAAIFHYKDGQLNRLIAKMILSKVSFLVIEIWSENFLLHDERFPSYYSSFLSEQTYKIYKIYVKLNNLGIFLLHDELMLN